MKAKSILISNTTRQKCSGVQWEGRKDKADIQTGEGCVLVKSGLSF